MDLAICSLASGSSGNCYLIKSNRAAILVDAGISARQISQKLSALGMQTEEILAVLITHEHSDHIKGISALSRSEGVSFYLNEKTLAASGIELPRERLRCFAAGESFEVEDIKISSFHLSHDAADPSGFSFESGGKRISIVTDTGVVTDEIYENVRDSDLLVLESNHDENILKMGRYPWFLKKRILSDKGHLSNEAAAELLKRILLGSESKQRQILLAHLSAENNFPEMALATVNNILEAEGLPVGQNVRISVLSRSEASPLYRV